MFARALANLFTPRNWGDVRPDDPSRYLRYLPVPQLPTNLQFTMDTAMQLSVVWACVDAISKALSSSYWGVYHRQSDGKRVHLATDPLDYILNCRANPELTAIGWRECILYAGLTWGNGYAEIVRDRAGKVKELWPLLPERMTPRRRHDKAATLFYDYYSLNGDHYELEQDQVFHLRGPSITGLMGENVVARAAKSIALAIAAERYALSYYSNNGIVGTRLLYPGKLDPATHERLRSEYDEKRAGAEKAHRPMILEGGMKLEQDTPDVEKSQIVNARTFQIEEICRWFGVPPHKVQHLLRATFNNIEHLGLEFVRDALVPWAKRLQQEADYKLFSKRGPERESRLDMTWLSQGDNESRAKAAVSWRNAGVKTANEIRHEEGLNAIGPEGDVILVGSGMKTLENVMQEVPAGTGPDAGGDQNGDGGKKGGKSDTEDPGSGRDPGESGSGESGGTPDGGSNSTRRTAQLVRDAVVTLFASAMERYQKRLANRQADLVRHDLPNSQVSENLALERERLRPWLLKECTPALELTTKIGAGAAPNESEILIAADAVDNGEQPRDAAERLVSSYLG